jgi:glycosyltransferase involved in cell wall biosynthesis
MPPITALLHTENDALRLGRALETLLPCAEVLIVDHHSTDGTLRRARQYGATILPAEGSASSEHYLDRAGCEWIFCLNPSESITESLQASLFEWSLLPAPTTVNAVAFSVRVREQTRGTWHRHSAPQTRLVPRNWTSWNGRLPAHHASCPALEGDLLRIASP